MKRLLSQYSKTFEFVIIAKKGTHFFVVLFTFRVSAFATKSTINVPTCAASASPAPAPQHAAVTVRAL